MDTLLMPLRIPSTWAVLYNSFGDVDPIVRDGSIVNFEFYKEDLLWMQRIQATSTGWTTYPDGHILDLGWYPDSDPKGTYRIVLIRGDWSNELLKFESKDRQKIRAVIERCLNLVMQGTDDQEISRLVTLE